MANTIAEDIAKIRNAVYGREVRESIAHGIEQCYSDVTNSKTLAENATESANNAAANANQKAQEAKTAATTIDSKIDDIVLVQDSQPDSETNKIWVKPESDEYKVPTWDEFQELSANTESAMTSKAEVDGYYKDMTVGDAEQLVSSQYVEDKMPYKFRTSGGSAIIGNREYVDKIIGGTVAWNQLVVDENIKRTLIRNNQRTYSYKFPTTIPKEHKYLMSIDLSDVVHSSASQYDTLNVQFNNSIDGTIIGFDTNLENKIWSGILNPVKNKIESAYFFISADASDTTSVTLCNFVVFDLTQMFGSNVADAIYAMERATAGAGVAWFRSMFPDVYYPYNAGELISVSGLQSHDTVGFNLFDKTTVTHGHFVNSNNISAANTDYAYSDYIPVIGGATYYYPISYGGVNSVFWYDSQKNVIGKRNGNALYTLPQNACYVRLNMKETDIDTACFNLSRSGAHNGEYQPYVKHSYPLDSSLILRGVPQLVDDKLQFDGDEYLPSGKVNRRYGIVDLGTLNWIIQSGVAGLFRTPGLNTLMKNNGKGITIGYKRTNYSSTFANDKEFYKDSNGNLFIHENSMDGKTGPEFKEFMSGKMLVYELTTPTEETAEAYQAIQLVDNLGTEEYVSGTICPVGHITRYPVDLVKKLEGLPSNFSTLIAPTEATTMASRAYTVGSYLILNNTLYKVTSAIANGATITPGTNVTATTIMAELMALV